MATHSKLYWCKGGGWLIMVDVSHTTLLKRTSEGGWLATLSTPPGSAPDKCTRTRISVIMFVYVSWHASVCGDEWRKMEQESYTMTKLLHNYYRII